MSVNYVSHKDIDQDRWDVAISNATNPKIYADSWYLNVTTEGQWDAIISDDYTSVMPLPFNKKLFGISQVYRPFFSQQLGVIHSSKAVDIEDFIKHIPSKFKRLHYAFNNANIVEGCTQKTNLILPLKTDYNTVVSNFSSSLRKHIKRSAELQLTETSNVEEVITFYKNHLESKVKLGNKGYDVATKLFAEALERGCAEVYQLTNGDDILASGVFLKKYSRIINVFASSINTKKHRNTMSVLLARVMEKHSESDYIFDFEGSDLKGVKQYFESFGSTEENYPVLHYNKLPYLVKLIRPS